MWYLYIIRCVDSSLYTGITTDVERRFNEHTDQGKLAAKYLRGKAPLTLVFTVEAGTRSEASTLEMRLKKMAKADKELVVSGDKSLTDLGLV
jgi:putative endonuclease